RVAAQNEVHERHDQRVVVHHLDLQQVGILHGDPARPDRVWTEGQVVVGQGVAAVVLALAVFLPRLGGRADDGDLGIPGQVEGRLAPGRGDPGGTRVGGVQRRQ